MIPTIFNCVLHYRKHPRQQPSTSFHKDSWITEGSKGEENTNYFSQDSFFYSYQRNRIHTTKSSIKYSYTVVIPTTLNQNCMCGPLKINSAKYIILLPVTGRGLLVTGGGYFQFLTKFTESYASCIFPRLVKHTEHTQKGQKPKAI